MFKELKINYSLKEMIFNLDSLQEDYVWLKGYI